MDKKGINFRPILISFLFALLFVVALLEGFGVMLLQNTGEIDVFNGTALEGLKTNVAEDLNTYAETTKEAGASFENSTISLTSGIPFIDSIYGVWKVLISTPKLMYNLITEVMFNTLLGDEASKIVFAVIGAILVITIIFAVVKLISTGDSG